MAKSCSLKELLEADEASDRIKTLSFEEGLALTDELIVKVESGTLPLESAINSYEKGVRLIEHLRGLLSGAEEKLKVLKLEPEGKGAKSGGKK